MPASAEPTPEDARAVDVRPLALEMTARLAAAGVSEARGDAWLLLAAVAGRGRAELMARPHLALDAGQRARLEALVARREAREPMAYILGEREFWSLPFLVSPAVLIPRPESETVVEAALAAVPDRDAPLRVIDLGTGSGCLLLALLSELPAACGLGVDRSEAALAVARENARRLGLVGRARLEPGDWGSGLATPFDLIVANPPYVSEPDHGALQPEVRDHEPAAALRAGPDGLAAYRALAPDLARLLAAGGTACLELGQGQAVAASAIMGLAGLATAAVRPDLAGIERCLVLRRRDQLRDR